MIKLIEDFSLESKMKKHCMNFYIKFKFFYINQFFCKVFIGELIQIMKLALKYIFKIIFLKMNQKKRLNYLKNNMRSYFLNYL